MKIFKLLCMVYDAYARELIKKAIDDPATEWDDVVLDTLDRIFHYGTYEK